MLVYIIERHESNYPEMIFDNKNKAEKYVLDNIDKEYISEDICRRQEELRTLKEKNNPCDSEIIKIIEKELQMPYRDQLIKRNIYFRIVERLVE